MSMVHISAGINAPASEHLLSEPMIVARLASAALPRGSIPWLQFAGDYRLLREKIAAVFDDFKDFNAKIEHPGGFRLDNTAARRVWRTASGKAEFNTHAIPRDTSIIAQRRRDSTTQSSSRSQPYGLTINTTPRFTAWTIAIAACTGNVA